MSASAPAPGEGALSRLQKLLRTTAFKLSLAYLVVFAVFAFLALGYVAWNAPGNIRAERGTLSFFWRSRTPVGAAPFNIFRVGFADHSSWDMAFARIDWNGHGFDAFVTDANLSRLRVSWRMPTPPTP